MTAADQQQEVREIKAAIDQPRRQRMAFEVVDRDQRLARGKAQSFADHQPDHHPADQPGTGGGGHGVHVGDRNVGLGEHLAD